jgi:hypothetical protein
MTDIVRMQKQGSVARNSSQFHLRQRKSHESSIKSTDPPFSGAQNES